MPFIFNTRRSKMKKIITFEFPNGDIVLEGDEGLTIFDILRDANLPIAGPCGGKGTCGKCLVKCLTDSFDLPNDAEKEKLGGLYKDGFRLACQLMIKEDACLELVLESDKAKIMVEAAEQSIQTDGEDGYAIAFDIGTTTIAGFLLDLKTGETIATNSALNAQRSYGADVITRCSYTLENEGGLEKLQSIVVKQLDTMCKKMIHQATISSDKIIRIVLAGNPVMMQLCVGMSVEQLAVLPYEPSYHQAFFKEAQELGLHSMIDTTPVWFMPVISGYVGADTIAASMAVEQDCQSAISLMIDIGTNGEIVLGNQDGLFCCSTAAGPAFEGGKIYCGMGGVEGAIEKIYDRDGPICETIGGSKAQGLCGSGLIDAVSVLLEQGCIDENGLLSDEWCVNSKYDQRFLSDGSFCLCSTAEGAEKDIVLTQQDIREIQLAKGAIAAGIEVLIKSAGIDWSDIDVVYLAGGFGSYIDYNSACHIGLLPQQLKNKIIGIGNAAGKGAREFAASEAKRVYANKLSSTTKYVELARTSQFNDCFMDQMLFMQAVDAE